MRPLLVNCLIDDSQAPADRPFLTSISCLYPVTHHLFISALCTLNCIVTFTFHKPNVYCPPWPNSTSREVYFGKIPSTTTVLCFPSSGLIGVYPRFIIPPESDASPLLHRWELLEGCNTFLDCQLIDWSEFNRCLNDQSIEFLEGTQIL